MKNILVITPKYSVGKRLDLVEDTKAIHYLIKNVETEKYNVLVYHTFHHYIVNFLNKPLKWLTFKREKIDKDIIDGIKVALIEIYQYIPTVVKLNSKLGHWIMKKQLTNQVKGLESILNDWGKTPDVVVYHFPSIYTDFMKEIKFKCKQIGIFHMSDIMLLEKDNSGEIQENLDFFLDGIGFRSKSIKTRYKKLNEINKLNFYVPSGIDSQIINYQKTVCDKNTINFIFVGKLIKRKNLDKLINAFYILNKKYSINLTIIGDGPEKECIKNLIRKYNLSGRIKFYNYLARQDVLGEMKKNDVFIMPSINETLGLVYLEAMASGCITIGVENEGIDGIINDGENGFLINLPTQENIVMVMEKIINLSVKEKQVIIENAMKKIELYTENKVSRDYYNNIRRVIEEEI